VVSVAHDEAPTPPPNHSTAPSLPPGPTATPRHPATPPQSSSHYPAIPPPVKVRLVSTGSHPCSYLPGRQSSNRAFWAEQMPPAVYHAFMDAGFRRSGKVVYQPACGGCRRCVSLRVPVATFAASKSQRRCWRHNRDLRVSVGPPAADAERFALYRTYTTQWHDKPADAADEDEYDSFVRFLYDSPVATAEYQYRDAAGRLLAVGICDVSDRSLSSVYFYHDPAESRRGLGTFGALYEIEDARRRGIPFYYLGYWVDECRTMSYKASYRPYELLGSDGVWRAGGDTSAATPEAGPDE
jgi:arginyl-tRNA--protein-N-Asp/Glu arginylyltransferase